MDEELRPAAIPGFVQPPARVLRRAAGPAFLSVILSEIAAATESKDPYSCQKAQRSAQLILRT
ncbi:MAG: hypothetical protein ACHP8B_01155 [Terriglobales bacterium]